MAGCSAGTSTQPPTGAPAPTSATETAVPGPKPSRAWRIPPLKVATDSQLSAYTDQQYIRPGDAVSLLVSTPAPTWSVSAFRVGYYDGKGAALVTRSGGHPGRVQSPPTSDPETRAVSVDWRDPVQLDTAGWQPGLYLLVFAAGGKQKYYPLVVLSDSADGAVALVAGDTTWQAYNTWGGRSLYNDDEGQGFAARSYAVSFDRPYNDNGARLALAFDVPIVQQAERSGVPLAYTSVTALTQDPKWLTGALGAVSNGHDEYWTVPYRRALTAARDDGTNLAFMGANAGYWRVRLEQQGRLVVGYKDVGIDPKGSAKDAGARWRDPPHADPENSLIGQMYDCFPSEGAMQIREPGFFLFEGTGVVKGQRFEGLIGIESDRAYPLESTPRPLQIPALSKVACRGTSTWSTMTYYTPASGAGVFATGTMNWPRALKGPSPNYGITTDGVRFARTTTQNLFQAMAQGPMGDRHPATDDLDDVNLPAQNTTGAA